MAKIASLCVYCGSSSQVPSIHLETAAAFGRLLAEAGVQLVFGGGRIGLMGRMADAAIAAGGRVVGVIPEYLQNLEIGHDGVAELVVVDSMHTRKRRMFELADAFAVLPGGLGTLDETFEMVTWRQLGMHEKPLVVVDVDGYWKPLQGLIEHMVRAGYCRPEHRGLMTFVDRIEDVLPTLKALPQPRPRAQAKWVG
jgi:uncharacterized protein (TIGR00730 family)